MVTGRGGAQVPRRSGANRLSSLAGGFPAQRNCRESTSRVIDLAHQAVVCHLVDIVRVRNVREALASNRTLSDIADDVFLTSDLPGKQDQASTPVPPDGRGGR
jgi:hypothetical protein